MNPKVSTCGTQSVGTGYPPYGDLEIEPAEALSRFRSRLCIGSRLSAQKLEIQVETPSL